jgi:hypothetical protein
MFLLPCVGRDMAAGPVQGTIPETWRTRSLAPLWSVVPDKEEEEEKEKRRRRRRRISLILVFLRRVCLQLRRCE